MAFAHICHLSELPADVTERDLIERHVARVIITPTAVEVRLMAGNVVEPLIAPMRRLRAKSRLHWRGRLRASPP